MKMQGLKNLRLDSHSKPNMDVPQETEHESHNSDIFISRRYNTFEYDPATADMEEVNRVIAEYEVKTGAQPFEMATGERLEKVTREQNEVLMVHPIAGC